jgi:uncharacterized protein DUF4435
MVNTTQCRIIIAHGKSHALEALAKLEHLGFKGVLAIVDSDFSGLDKATARSGGNIVCTDTHDIETLMIASPALEKVLREYGEDASISAFLKRENCDLRSAILRCGATIGYLRWASHKNNWGLRFDGLSFSDFTSEKALSINQDKLLDAVQSLSGKGRLLAVDVISAIDHLKSQEGDLWHVCCGHDLVEIFSIGFRRVLGRKNEADVKPLKLEKDLRLAYERSYFADSNIYKSIRLWETKNQPFLVLYAPHAYGAHH